MSKPDDVGSGFGVRRWCGCGIGCPSYARSITTTLNSGFRVAGNCDIIDKDRDNDAHSISQIDPDTVLADETGEAKLGEHLVELLMPAATSLLQPIERFAKPPDPLRGLLLKTLRLLHVDFLLELTIEVGRGDVHRLEF